MPGNAVECLISQQMRQREGLYHGGQARDVLVVIFGAFTLTASQKGQTPTLLAGSFPLSGCDSVTSAGTEPRVLLPAADPGLSLPAIPLALPTLPLKLPRSINF